MLECHLLVDEALALVCMGTVLVFLCGVGIGANDLSANFAMVVGSGSLPLKSAIWYCIVFELLGAAFMGTRISDTLRFGIVSAELYNGNPDMVIGGMVAASFASAAWLFLSIHYSLPVSITHTIVGSIVGFGIFSLGTTRYVELGGVLKIVVSWLVAPLAAGVGTAFVYRIVRKNILRSHTPFTTARKTMSLCVFAAITLNIWFVILERPPILDPLLKRISMFEMSLLLFAALALATALSHAYLFPSMAQKALRKTDFVWQHEVVVTSARRPLSDEGASEASYGGLSDASPRTSPVAPMARVEAISAAESKFVNLKGPRIKLVPKRRHDEDVHVNLRKDASFFVRTAGALLDGSVRRSPSQQSSDTGPIHEVIVSPAEADPEDENYLDPRMVADHPSVTMYHPRAEYMFTAVQVICGASSSFVHGAVAGATATAPFLSAYTAFAQHHLGMKEPATGWIMGVAMAGITLGMMVLGHRLVKTVGVELVTITPSRGFSMQFGGTLVTMFLTAIGIPVSLTQCQVGAAIGCGMLDSGKAGVSWMVVGKIFLGWFFTLIISACTTGIVMRIIAHVGCGW